MKRQNEKITSTVYYSLRALVDVGGDGDKLLECDPLGRPGDGPVGSSGDSNHPSAPTQPVTDAGNGEDSPGEPTTTENASPTSDHGSAPWFWKYQWGPSAPSPEASDVDRLTSRKV